MFVEFAESLAEQARQFNFYLTFRGITKLHRVGVGAGDEKVLALAIQFVADLFVCNIL